MRKRHIAVDTLGLLLSADPADLADGGYAGTLLDWARTSLNITPRIVKRTDDVTGFVVLPPPALSPTRQVDGSRLSHVRRKGCEAAVLARCVSK